MLDMTLAQRWGSIDELSKKNLSETAKKILAVIEAFESPENDRISAESKGILISAVELLLNLLAQEKTKDVELKEKSDVIIVGAIIALLAFEDSKYSLQNEFDNKFLYPLTYREVLAGFSGNIGKDAWIYVGKKALDGGIPFTGEINYKILPSLKGVINKDHFSEYTKLNRNPSTMDTTERSQRLIQSRVEAREKRKWDGTFGGDSPDSVYTKRKETLISKYNKQENDYSKEVLLWKGLVVLVAIATLFVFFPLTRPWLDKKRAEIEQRHKNASLVRREFTIEQYEAIKETRKTAKASFTEKSTEEFEDYKSGGTQKPKKVCIALDADGNETSRDRMSTVVMYGDKAQAKRWDLEFFNKDQDKVQREYLASKEESIKSAYVRWY